VLGFALLGCALSVTAFPAALADDPPRDVNLGGSWTLDAALSDNPKTVLDSLRVSLEAQKLPRRLGARTPSRRRDEDELTGDDHGAKLLRDLEIESRTAQRAKQMEQFSDILRNPASLQIEQRLQLINLVADYDHLECQPGERVSVMDTAGAGQRVCGWQGPALVVLLKRQRGGSSVERRYELDAARQTLIYTTTLTPQTQDEKLPVVKLRRVYRRGALSADPPAGASPAH
jgi:hypothetical protein